jgi:phenylpropionate dioxygenase-like ring-hydroxylating dioxygenase large terminal subunit
VSEAYDYKQGYIVYPDGSGGPDGVKAPYIDHGAELVDTKRYYCPEQAKLEEERFWNRVWCFAGLTHDLANVGDYFTYDVGKESFIIVRSAPDRIQAFHNVCPHRGNQLVYGDYGRIAPGGSFYCNFHGWRFNLDGSLREIKDRHIFRTETVCDLHSLKEVRCEVWNSMVFINMDPRAMPLEEYLGVIPKHLAYCRMDRMRVYSELRGVVDANWKLAMEAFLEFYHADDTHPQVLPISGTLKTQYDLYEHGMSRMIIPIGYAGDRADDPDEVTDALKGFIAFFGGDPAEYGHIKGQDYRRAYADTLRKWAARNGHADLFERMSDGQITDDWNYHIFPNVTLNVFSWGLLIQTWTPHATDPRKHVYRTLSMLLPVKDPNQAVMDPASFAVSAEKGWNGSQRPKPIYPQKLEEWGTVLSQDVERIPKVQRGIESRCYEGHRLCESESRIRHYLAELDKYLKRP